jgi:flagellar biosynthesis protein FlhB
VAESEKDSRTEEATPKKKDKLRSEGSIAKSADVGGAAVMIAGGVALASSADAAAREVAAVCTRCFSLQDHADPLRALEALLPALSTALLPLLGATMIAGIVAGVAQTRGLFSFSLLAPKPERLNPLPNLKTVLPTKDSAIEIGKQLVKITVVGFVVYEIVSNALPEFGVLATSSPMVAAATVGAVATDVAIYGGVVFAVLAAADYWLAIRKFSTDAKMSKEDVKEEHKEQEGRPEVKARRRHKAREIAKRRAIADVKNATVLVCNPTHIAIALRYDAGTPAPIVIAKGTDDVALKMRAEGRHHGIPIVENRPLARALNASAKIGKPIPVDLYRAVAEIIAHVMRIGGVPRVRKTAGARR